MRDTLVQGRMGLGDLTDARDRTRALLEAEQAELSTVRRRKGQAEKIGDAETVEIAARFEVKHADRVEVLTRKLSAQEDEVRLVTQELEEMTAALKSAAKGAGMAPRSAAASAAAEVNDIASDSALRQDIDALKRHAEAEARLRELKLKMGKE
jgi:hypothetical protein